MNLKKKDQLIILKAMSHVHDVSYWGMNFIKDYLRELNKKDNSILIHASPNELQSKILSWIDSVDSDLSIFYKYHKLSESERAKTLMLFKIPDEYKNQITNILQNYQNIEYDPYSAGSWASPTVVYSEKNENKIEIWFAVKASKDTNTNLDINKLDTTILDSLLTHLQKNNPNAENITNLKVGYIFSTRIINILSIDTDGNNISLSTDQPKTIDPDDDELHVVKPEDRLLSFVAKAVEKIGFKDSEKVADAINSKRRINKVSIKNIKTLQSIDCLILPYSFEILHETGDSSEKNIDKFFKLTSQNLKPAVAKYFNEKGTFAGFLNSNPTLDVETNGVLLKALRSVKGIESTGQNFFIFLHNDNNELEAARISCNISTGHLRLMLEKGSNIHEKIYAKLDKLFP